jgi:hypothetical protein
MLIDFLESKKIPCNVGVNAMFTVAVRSVIDNGVKLEEFIENLTGMYKIFEKYKEKNEMDQAKSKD